MYISKYIYIYTYLYIYICRDIYKLGYMIVCFYVHRPSAASKRLAVCIYVSHSYTYFSTLLWLRHVNWLTCWILLLMATCLAKLLASEAVVVKGCGGHKHDRWGWVIFAFFTYLVYFCIFFAYFSMYFDYFLI